MAKKAQGTKAAGQPELIKALCDAGYALEGFSRRGRELSVRLVPADLTDRPSGYPKAFDVTDALGLQAQCRVFAAVPQDLLVVTVELPEPKAKSLKPKASAHV